MSTPYLGETRIFAFGFAFGFAPAGWMACEGQLMPVSEFPDLFKLIGTTYGGDGETTFAVPKAAGPESEETVLSICISLFGDVPAGG